MNTDKNRYRHGSRFSCRASSFPPFFIAFLSFISVYLCSSVSDSSIFPHARKFPQGGTACATFAARLCWLHGATGLSAVRRHRMEDGRPRRGRRKPDARVEGKPSEGRRDQTRLGGAVRLHGQATAPRERSARARIPNRYEHCDFENFDTDFRTRDRPNDCLGPRPGAGQGGQEAFARDYPAGSETGLLLMGPCGVGKTHLAVAALRQLFCAGTRDFLRLPRAAQGNSGQLRSRKPDQRNGRARARADSRSVAPR